MRWILAFALVATHLIITDGTGRAGVESFLDRFEAPSYSNSDGSQVWASDWQEVGEPTDPLAGGWRIVDDTGFGQYSLEKRGAASISVQRLANLEGFSSAILSFDYRRAFLPPGKSIEVQVSAGGTVGPWATVTTISGSAPPATDPSYVTETVDISSFISAETAIRFHHPSGSGSFGQPMAVFIDNVEIAGDLANRAPVLSGVGDVSGGEGSVIGFTAVGSDPDAGDSLTFSLGGSVPEGASISAGGVFSWVPSEAQGPGDYTFDVVVADDGVPSLSDSETITVTVLEVNTAPVVSDLEDRLSGEGDSVSVVVEASDGDVPADTLTWSASGLPPGLEIDGSTGEISGVVDYSAAASSPYSVEVTASDGDLDGSASFQWTVTDANRAPVLSGVGDVSGGEGSVIGFTAVGSDPDAGDSLTFSLGGSVPEGASISAGGVFSWVPSEAQGPGDYTFDVVVADDGVPSLSDSETITVTVLEVNTAPVARDDRYTVVLGGTLRIDAPGVLDNDADPDSDDLSARVAEHPERGELSLEGDGSLTYAHTGGNAADDSFAYTVSDGNGGNATASVTIVVVPPPNRPPVAADDSIRLDEDTAVSFDVLANDEDPDGDELAVTFVEPSAEGEITLEEGGTLRFVPTPDYHGTTRTRYTIEDGNGGSATAEVVFEVAPVNDHPRATADEVVLDGYLPHHIAVLDNDSDPDEDRLRVVSVGTPDRGQVAIDGRGVVFTPPKAWVGSTSFTYTVADGKGGRSEAVVDVKMPLEAQVLARQLSNDLGTGQLKARWIDSAFDSRVDLALSPLLGLELFVKAFFQSLDGIELSIALLGMTALVLAGLSLATRLPVAVPFGSSRYWSAVLVGRESQLEIRERPNRSSQVIYQLRPTTKGIESEPAPRLLPKGWIPVETPRGQGWAETDHLTEQVDAQSFMEDARPHVMAAQFANRLRRRKDITRLVGRRGLIADLGAGVQVIERETLRSLSRAGSHRSNQVPNHSEFRSNVVKPFLEAYEASGEISADSSHSKSVLLPTEILNFWYLTVGGPGVGMWLVLFEYERGRPRIVGIIRDE